MTRKSCPNRTHFLFNIHDFSLRNVTLAFMDTDELSSEAMRERVDLKDVAHNVLEDTIDPDLARKYLPDLSEDQNEWSMTDMRELLKNIDPEAFRIPPDMVTEDFS